MTIRNCPVEIALEIFSLACSDDGRTSRALSLVSKDFHSVSLPFRFRTLSIYSPEQLVRTIDVLLARPCQLRRVEHLHINIMSGRDVPSFVSRLLTLLSSSLQTLSLCTFEYWGSVIPTELPALRELTLYTNISSASFLGSLQAPLLQRLHIAFYNTLPEGFAECISRIAPNLTHLRLSNVSQSRGNGDLVQALATLVSGVSADRGAPYAPPQSGGVPPQTPRVPSFPSTLQRCIIAQAATRAVRYESMQCIHTYLGSQLERLGAEDRSGRLHILKLAPYYRATSYWDSTTYDEQALVLKNEWLDRIAGGDGCWNPREIRVIPLTYERPWQDFM